MRRILVVCTGNICRSPVLERLLARDLTDRGVAAVVRSAGTHAVGSGAHPDTTAAAEMAGLDLHGHLGRQLTETMIDDEGADLVVTLTQQHSRRVLELRPDAAPRTGTIRELAHRLDVMMASELPASRAWRDLFADRSPSSVLGDDAQLDVADPYGRSAIEHVATVHELAGLSATVSQRLAEFAVDD